MNKQFGDFQTPPELVKQVIAVLAQTGRRWGRILEPTCGIGNFVKGLLKSTILDNPAEILGVEIQTAHFQIASTIDCSDPRFRLQLINASIFDINLKSDLPWKGQGDLLVIGNPPWITNAQLGVLGSDNLPQKKNLKGLAGLDALTGGSNFDIAEYIWFKLIDELASEYPTIALLCKTSVARSILQLAHQRNLPVARAEITRIDAKKWFGVAVDACLFTINLGSHLNLKSVPIYANLTDREPKQNITIRNGNIISDIAVYEQAAALDGVFPFTWRQGIKHDAADVMELTQLDDGTYRNKLEETVSVEAAYVYPLLKGSNLFNHLSFPIGEGNRYVIVTQHNINEDTRRLQHKAPELWQYLQKHGDVFERRKSSIYRGKSPFSIFGVGEYSFSAYKVAIAGLYKTPKFVAVGPRNKRPVLFDDTCYFVTCDSALQCAALCVLLNSSNAQTFLAATSFADNKRPVTKKLLQRINLHALVDQADINQLYEASKRIEAQIAADGAVSHEDTAANPIMLKSLLLPQRLLL